MDRDTKDLGNPEQSIEQLWYTWSGIGLGTIPAGFRIRAASRGLSNIHSKRVKNLEGYLGYGSRQGGNDSHVHPNQAPTCLSLIDDGHDRILVHKKSIDVGPSGNYFIHLLAGLPDEFSAKEAISLWGSSFWKSSDVDLTDPPSTELNRVSLDDVRQGQISTLKLETVEPYLPYIIQTYLTKQLPMQASDRPKLYIVASDKDVARLIWGLTHCLPTLLVQGLTFSTYEYDVTKATTEFVGTYMPSEAGDHTSMGDVLPANYYQTRLAINCYTNRFSSLENNPLLEAKPLAALFARDATAYIVHNEKAHRFELLLAGAECYQSLNRDTFFAFYEDVVRGEPESIIKFVEQVCCLPYISASPTEQVPVSQYRKAFLEFMSNLTKFLAHEPNKYKDEYYIRIVELLRKLVDNRDQLSIVLDLFGHLVRSEYKQEKVEFFMALYLCPVDYDTEYQQKLYEAAQFSQLDKVKLRWFQKLAKKKEEKSGQREKEIGKSGSVHQQQTSFFSPDKPASGSSHELTPPIERKIPSDAPSSHRPMTEQTAREFPKTDSAGTRSKKSQTGTILPGWLRKLLGKWIKLFNMLLYI